ncbi:MAG: glycosyltransferase [Deltaproteobacteria bacterium]|nr:glycosyltransferase [Deltaproteobacteria bacterium]
MRILTVGAIQGGTIPIGRALFNAFKEIGLDAEFLDYSDVQEEFLKIVAGNDRERSYQFHLNTKIRLLQTVSDFKPDVIFGIAQAPLNDISILSQFKQSGITLCYWFTEDYRIFEYWNTIAPYFDHFFTIQQEPFWQELNQVGCTNYHYLPMAFDTSLEWHSEEEATIPVSFVGAPYPNRVHFFTHINDNGFHIYGEGWDKYANPKVSIGNRRISENEARSIYRRSLININFHSSPFSREFGGGDFVNPRTFELAGMGAFQLADMRKLMSLHFDPAEEVIALSRWEDMVWAIEYFLEHETERNDLATKAQARVLKEHTYRHRAEEIMSVLHLK